jgi:hypothetical protein
MGRSRTEVSSKGELIFAAARIRHLQLHSHFGNSQKNISKKWKKITTQNQGPKSPQITINPPQTHHEFTIKKHHIFANPLQKGQ